jgi:adenosylcobinamide-GDP ribazoletransferase
MSVIGREWYRFVTAMQTLTRIPMPRVTDLDREPLERSARYFTLVGAFVGVASAGALMASALVLPHPLPAIIAIVVALMLTGAFHEDGLADTYDGLFGGQTRERRIL